MQHSIYRENLSAMTQGRHEVKFGNRAAATNKYKIALHYRRWSFPCTYSDVHARVITLVIVKI